MSRQVDRDFNVGKSADSREQYFLGAQIDVSGIVKDCPGLEAHKRALNQEPAIDPQSSAKTADFIPVRQSSRQTTSAGSKPRQGSDRVRNKLRAFFEKLASDEIALLRESRRSVSAISPQEAKIPQPNRKASNKSMRLERQYLSDDDPVLIDDHDGPPTPTIPASLAGSLPGVYQNYLLVRPAPSLNILFASSALQSTADLRQTPLLNHISTSVNTLAGLQKAFSLGIPVTGRVIWRPAARNESALSSHGSWHSGQEGLGTGVAVSGQSQWLSATPLVGSDDRVGVWVVVIIKASHGGGAMGEVL